MTEIPAEGYRNEPYWWEAARPQPAAEASLPKSCDVAIVGAGLTGLRCALALLRAGRSVVVLDKDDPGFGASRRNAGFLGRVLKKSLSTLIAKRGIEHALAVYRELDAAYQSTLAFIAEEGIECHAVRCGRFIGATSPNHYEDLGRELELMRRHLGIDYAMVTKAEQHAEIASDVYFGGAVIPDLGALHPGLYHRGLQERVLHAGGIVRGGTEVLRTGAAAGGAGFEVVTANGTFGARDVVVATNGYTPRQFPWLARRVIPFTGYMAATQEMAPALLQKVIPHRRTVLNTDVDIDFFRPSPDSPRLIFGGATGSGMLAVEEIAQRLRAILGRVLPDLAGARLGHVWTGQCAGTFDMMPHIGRAEGIWYAMGYNFAGLPMGTYLGLKLAQKIMGLSAGATVFDGEPFPTMALYRGNPWFVPLAMRWFRWQDRRTAAPRSGSHKRAA